MGEARVRAADITPEDPVTAGSDVRVLIAGAPGTGGIPADVFGTISAVIGAVYPNARMGAGDPHLGGFTLVLSPEDRAPRTKLGKRAAARAFTPRTDPLDDETLLIGFDGQDLLTATPDEVTRNLAALGMLVLDKTDGATNYVETRAHHADIGTVLITVARSEGQTPHAMHEAAKSRAETAENLLDQARQAIQDEDTPLAAGLRELVGEPAADDEEDAP